MAISASRLSLGGTGFRLWSREAFGLFGSLREHGGRSVIFNVRLGLRTGLGHEKSPGGLGRGSWFYGSIGWGSVASYSRTLATHACKPSSEKQSGAPVKLTTTKLPVGI